MEMSGEVFKNLQSRAPTIRCQRVHSHVILTIGFHVCCFVCYEYCAKLDLGSSRIVVSYAKILVSLYL